MTSRILRAAIVLSALALLGTGQARAEMVHFSYKWTFTPPVVSAGTGQVAMAGTTGTGTYDTTASTASTILGATVSTNSSATPPTPADSFNSPFSVKLTLTDTASNQSADLMYSGTVKGTLTATTAELTSTFNDPLMRMAKLGGHLYSVTIVPTLTLPSPTSTTPAPINAMVTVQNAPEPSTLVLGATAVLGFAVRRLSRKRRSPKSV